MTEQVHHNCEEKLKVLQKIAQGIETLIELQKKQIDYLDTHCTEIEDDLNDILQILKKATKNQDLPAIPPKPQKLKKAHITFVTKDMVWAKEFDIR